MKKSRLKSDLSNSVTGSSPSASSEAVRIQFDSFILDRSESLLWKHDTVISLTPKSFSVLEYLVMHAGQLVTKDMLFASIWSDVIVTEAALTVCVREIRKALNDSTRRPLYIETVYKRGFRFIAPLQYHDPPVKEHLNLLVGRQESFSMLINAWETMMAKGYRKLVFLTGEAGIGKTSLLEQFAATYLKGKNCWIAKGQCIEHHGGGEPYLPILDAVNHLCLSYQEEVKATLEKFSPSVMQYLPNARVSQDNSPLNNQGLTNKSEFLIREITDALEAVSHIKPLVLYLEDLHWCDPSTTEFLSFFAMRQSMANIIILATFRPAEAFVENTALRDLKQNLLVRDLCVQIPLDFLNEEEINQYLTANFSSNNFPQYFSRYLFQQTSGNPLFIKNILSGLESEGILHCSTNVWELAVKIEHLSKFVPNNLLEMIDNRIERLKLSLQELLEAASIAGEPGATVSFTLAEVAAAMNVAPLDCELGITRLAKEGLFLNALGTIEYPNHSLTESYTFVHVLYQNVSYNRVSITRKARFHRRIAFFLEKTFVEKKREIISKLAVHFELGHEFLKAAEYLYHIAKISVNLGAGVEAIISLEKALKLVNRTPSTLERYELELSLLQLLAPIIISVHGNAAPEVERIFKNALRLCKLLDNQAEQFPISFGLRSYYLITGEHGKARQLSEELMALSESTGDKGLMLEAHVGQASCLFYQGDLAQSYQHALAGIQLYDACYHKDHAVKYGLDPGVFCYARAGQCNWALGFPDQALNFVISAVNSAEATQHHYSQVFAYQNLSLIYLYRREGSKAQVIAEQTKKLALDHNYIFMQVWACHHIAWALAIMDDASGARSAISEALKLQPVADNSFLKVFLAECYWHLSDYEAGISVLKYPTEVRAFEAERLRLLAEFYYQKALVQKKSSEQKTYLNYAKEHYQQALICSTRQGANSYSLRILIGLCRLLSGKGRGGMKTKEMLFDTYALFAEGHDTIDLQEAKQTIDLFRNEEWR